MIDLVDDVTDCKIGTSDNARIKEILLFNYVTCLNDTKIRKSTRTDLSFFLSTAILSANINYFEQKYSSFSDL